MGEPFNFFSLFYLANSILWILLQLSIAALVFFRFRVTASSFLIGIPMLLQAFKGFIIIVLHRVLFSSGGADLQTLNVIDFLSLVMTIFLMLFVGLGIGLIPKSLRALAKK
jgi:hypothetical protein